MSRLTLEPDERTCNEPRQPAAFRPIRPTVTPLHPVENPVENPVDNSGVITWITPVIWESPSFDSSARARLVSLL